MSELKHRFLFQQFASGLIRHYAPAQKDSASMEDFFNEISKYDLQARVLLDRLRCAEDTHHFILHDTELRIKVPELWQMQLKQTAAETEVCAKQLTHHLNKAGINIKPDMISLG
jgi:IS5 family transposase